jgi:hypothetical protein
MGALRTVDDYDQLNPMAIVIICYEGKEQYGGLVVQKDDTGLWTVPGIRLEKNTEAMVSDLQEGQVGYLLHVGIVPELLEEATAFWTSKLPVPAEEPVPDGN